MDIVDGYAAIRWDHFRDENLLASELPKQQKVDWVSSLVPLLFDSCNRTAIGQPAQLFYFFLRNKRRDHKDRCDDKGSASHSRGIRPPVRSTHRAIQ